MIAHSTRRDGPPCPFARVASRPRRSQRRTAPPSLAMTPTHSLLSAQAHRWLSAHKNQCFVVFASKEAKIGHCSWLTKDKVVGEYVDDVEVSELKKLSGLHQPGKTCFHHRYRCVKIIGPTNYHQIPDADRRAEALGSHTFPFETRPKPLRLSLKTPA
jgi:hypothetical protein